MQILSATNLSKTFDEKTFALKNLTCSIQCGQITGLVGPDGAGKTTLMRLLAGLMQPSAGQLEVLGFSMPQNSSEFLQNIGYMPQRFGLYEDLSIDENLKLYAELQNIDNVTQRIEELLDFIALKPFRKRIAGDLSGGMKQKLGLACALIKKPKVLLLDEPGVGVDPISRRELWKMVQELLKDDVGIVWSTSYLDEAQKCDAVILLNLGESLYQGPPQVFQQRMQGRVYLLSATFENKRDVFTKVLEDALVLDAVLVGEKIRVSLKKKADFPQAILNYVAHDAVAIPVEPNFEDAFVDILGVATQAHSNLAQKMQEMAQYDGNLIEAHGLTKKFGTFVATDNIDFRIQRGEVFGFLGPNGTGKSTTFKMLCGLLTPSSGSATVMGKDLYKAGADVRSSIGYMAQKFSLYSNLGVKDNLDFFAGVYGLQGKKKREKIDEMIESFDFHAHLHINAGVLPLGLKQRLALACSVMHDPQVLFLDEPTSGVDPITRKEFWTHINGMVRKGMSIMVTTHFMDEAEYCDKVMLIYRGKAIATGTPDRLKAMVSKDASMEDTFINLIKKYDNE